MSELHEIELLEGWEPMNTFPKDGTRCDILIDGGTVVKDIWWGLPPIGTQMTFIGSQNILSPWLQKEDMLRGWRVKQ